MNIFKRRLNVLVIGSNGMLGKELVEFLRNDASSKYGITGIVRGLDYPDIDITDNPHVSWTLDSMIHFDYVINCAAITDTRRIESDLKDQSYAVNALACKNLAVQCQVHKSKLIHISTDYVFSELAKHHRAFKTDDTPFPVNTYGMHKLLGENFIQMNMDSDMYTICRVSWLYGKHNFKSFIHKFAANCVKTLNDNPDSAEVAVNCTENEFSCPTSCSELCKRILNIMRFKISGIVNGCDMLQNSAEAMSRLDFAKLILNNILVISHAGSDDIDNRYQIFSRFHRLKLTPVKMTANGAMRYPEYSALSTSGEKEVLLNTGVHDAETAIAEFICTNLADIGKWLESKFKTT